MAKSTSKRFKDPLDSICWKAYNDPKFFDRLVEGMDDTAKLKSTIEKKGVVGVTDDTIKRVQESLKRRSVGLSPIELMQMLHKYTTPKKSWGAAGASWCMW
jgi:hypothetical protein